MSKSLNYGEFVKLPPTQYQIDEQKKREDIEIKKIDDFVKQNNLKNLKSEYYSINQYYYNAKNNLIYRICPTSFNPEIIYNNNNEENINIRKWNNLPF